MGGTPKSYMFSHRIFHCKPSMLIHFWGTPHFRKPPHPSYFELFTAAVSATKKKDLVSCPSLWP